MINPLRRLLYELTLLPLLTLLQKGVDLCVRGQRRLHAATGVRPQVQPWETLGDYSKRVRHLSLLFAAACLLASVPAMAQQTPPYFPSGTSDRAHPTKDPQRPDSGNPSGPQTHPPMPPDTNAPAHTKLTTAEAQQQIQNKLDDEPLLEGLSLLAAADDESVTLTGTVNNEQQRDAALRIVRSYSGDRKIVDQLTLAKAQ